MILPKAPGTLSFSSNDTMTRVPVKQKEHGGSLFFWDPRSYWIHWEHVDIGDPNSPKDLPEKKKTKQKQTKANRKTKRGKNGSISLSIFGEWRVSESARRWIFAAT